MAGDEGSVKEHGKVFGVGVMGKPGFYLDCLCETRNVANQIADQFNTNESTDRYIVTERVLEEYKPRDAPAGLVEIERWLVIGVGRTVWIEAVCQDKKSALWRAEEASGMYDQIEYYIYKISLLPGKDETWRDTIQGEPDDV